MDLISRNSLVLEHLHLADAVVGKHRWRKSVQRYGIEDALQLCRLVLVIAANRWKDGRWPFPRYAVYLMTKNLLVECYCDGVVRVPRRSRAIVKTYPLGSHNVPEPEEEECWMDLEGMVAKLPYHQREAVRTVYWREETLTSLGKRWNRSRALASMYHRKALTELKDTLLF